MDFNKDFVPLALRTESNIPPLTVNRLALAFVVDACVSIGNLADMMKKKAAYNKPIDVQKWKQLVHHLQENCLPFISQLKAEDFEKAPEDEPLAINTRLFHGIIGIFTESTELMEALEKNLQGQEWDLPNLKEEIGDQCWYQAILVDELNGDMDKIQTVVIDKLKKRYPEKYTDEAAINRDLAAERKILEA